MVLSVGSLPTARPDRLRLASLAADWYRLDETVPEAWSWEGYPAPRNRFDVSGQRVRYAARTERGAFREHFAETRRTITARHAALSVVHLTGRLRVIDLRSEPVLDALSLDGEISTGRSERAFDACWAVAERLVAWYGTRLHGIVYSSRTTPQTSANLAFFQHAPLRVVAVHALADRRALIAQLILDDGFRVDLPGWV